MFFFFLKTYFVSYSVRTLGCIHSVVLPNPLLPPSGDTTQQQDCKNRVGFMYKKASFRAVAINKK